MKYKVENNGEEHVLDQAVCKTFTAQDNALEVLQSSTGAFHSRLRWGCGVGGIR